VDVDRNGARDTRLPQVFMKKPTNISKLTTAIVRIITIRISIFYSSTEVCLVFAMTKRNAGRIFCATLVGIDIAIRGKKVVRELA
jgi:hypothetical protein